jgi:hypothetical protein
MQKTRLDMLTFMAIHSKLKNLHIAVEDMPDDEEFAALNRLMDDDLAKDVGLELEWGTIDLPESVQAVDADTASPAPLSVGSAIAGSERRMLPRR